MSPALSFDPIAEARRQWNKHWERTATPAMSAVTSIMRVHQILMARLNAVLEPFGLTFPRNEALMLLHYSRRGSLPLGKMGDRLQVHTTSVTNTIDGLERLGYVERAPHPEDRRATLAVITAPGGRPQPVKRALAAGAASARSRRSRGPSCGRAGRRRPCASSAAAGRTRPA